MIFDEAINFNYLSSQECEGFTLKAIWHQNGHMFNYQFRNFNTLFQFIHAHLLYYIISYYGDSEWHHELTEDFQVIHDVGNCCNKCKIVIGSEIFTWHFCFDSCLIFCHLPNHFTVHFMKWIMNGFFSVHYFDLTYLGLCLGYIPMG